MSIRKNGAERIYNRHMFGLRIEELPPEDILAMHEYFLELQKRQQNHEAEFNLALAPLYNALRGVMPIIVERGNCAWWVSQGLYKANVLTKPSIWPKSIWINMFENYNKTDIKEVDNIRVVSYRRAKHAKLSYGINAYPISAVAPLQSIRGLLYYNLERFANVIVEVPEGELSAVVIKQEEPEKPSQLRNIANNGYFIFGSVVVTLGILFSFHSSFKQSLYRRLNLAIPTTLKPEPTEKIPRSSVIARLRKLQMDIAKLKVNIDNPTTSSNFKATTTFTPSINHSTTSKPPSTPASSTSTSTSASSTSTPASTSTSSTSTSSHPPTNNS
eukprot:TRINITY_DN2608_c0_g1_i2.p1 TRINITY_DN2608_c0_g1~~TRINITY_DN2608_c0_g1_i2.p1  ORF type:complete len:329 (-),score=77.38 TRINITY_DN2608_c0_g1_i2:31-1017(-)